MFNMHTTMLYYFKQEPKEKERIAKSTILKCSSTFLQLIEATFFCFLRGVVISRQLLVSWTQYIGLSINISIKLQRKIHNNNLRKQKAQFENKELIAKHKDQNPQDRTKASKG